MKTGKHKYYVYFSYLMPVCSSHIYVNFINPIQTGFFFRLLEPKLREC